MKSLIRLTWIAMLSLLQIHAKAQCDSSAQFLTYDSVVIGSSNDYYNFVFPKFDATIGTLVDVTFTTKVTLNFSFTLENKESSALNYRVRLVRDHEMSSPSLNTPLTDSRSITYGFFRLEANNFVPGSGPDFVERQNLKPLLNYTVNQSVYNTADFMGIDSVNIDYFSMATSYAMGSLNNNYTSTANDTLQLIMSYKFCPTSQLASDITNVIAYKKDKLSYIKWNGVNETDERTYFVQRKIDGKDFVNIHKVKADKKFSGRYEYSYRSDHDKGKVQFRIVALEKSGASSASRIRMIDYGTELNAERTMKLFPNPTSSTAQLMFSNTIRGDYDVQVLTITGQLIKQYQFRNVLMAKINNQNELRRGTYMIRVISKSTGEQMSRRLVVQ
ncbi:MAG: choice-of-anchor E domain-containing protein [Flavitalea sp.]